MEDTGASAGSVANPIQTDNFNFAFSQPSPENHGILAAPTFPLLHFGDAPAAVQTPASDLHSTPSSSVPLSDQPSTNATSQAEHRNATAIPPLSIAEGFGDLFGCQISPAAGPQAPTSNEATQHAFLPPQPLNGFGELFQNQTPLVAGSQAPTSNDVAQRMLHQVAQQVSFPAQPSSIGQVSLPVPPTDLATLSSTISPGRNAPMITPTSQSSPVPADPPLDSQAHQPVDKRRSGRSVIPSKRIVAMNEIGTNVLKGLPQNESAAEKENVDPKGHPEWVTLAVDHLLMRDLGSEWQDCVNAWLELELRLGYGAVTGSKVCHGHHFRSKPSHDGTSQSALPAIDLRPEEWQKWVQKSRNGFRKYDTTPTVSDPAEFGICIMKWWHEMQPAFRKSPHGDKPLPTYTPPDPALWDCLRKGGPNGMVSVMTLAVWWGQSLSARTRWQDDSSENWKEFIMDVQKTISEIARTTIERKKRGAPGGAGNKSKRAKVQNK